MPVRFPSARFPLYRYRIRTPPALHAGQRRMRASRLEQDLALGERHILLIGNQGTGKNKLADKLLQADRPLQPL
jgi:hypothetical protein